jgi:hypothetical protein
MPARPYIARFSVFSRCPSVVTRSDVTHRARPFGGSEQASAISLASAAAILLSLNASPPSAASAFNRMREDACLHQLLRWMLAGMDKAIKLLPLRRTELYNIFLHCDLFGGQGSAPSLRYGSIDSDILLIVNDGGASDGS